MIKHALLFVWELPQNALGVMNAARLFATKRVKRVRYARERVMIETTGNAISLGLFVFFTKADNPYVPVGAENVDHEWGHSVQSRRLGPLYLPLVGVPSTMRVAYAVAHKLVRGERWGHYYDGWPERQADELGGVDRSKRPSPSGQATVASSS